MREGILKQFLLLLREIVGVNRAAVFLRQPFASFDDARGEGRRLRAASAIGLSSSLLSSLRCRSTRALVGSYSGWAASCDGWGGGPQ